MVLTGSSRKILTGFVEQLGIVENAKQLRDQSRAQYVFNKRLSELTEVLCYAATLKNAELSLQMERVSIAFEREQYAVTKEDIKRLDKQTSESGAAEQSLILVKHPEAYKAHVETLFPNGIPSALPEGDAYITHARRQIQYLSQAQKGMVTPQEKNFFEARQNNLRMGIAAFKKIQKIALFPFSIKNTQ